MNDNNQTYVNFIIENFLLLDFYEDSYFYCNSNSSEDTIKKS